MKGLFLTLDDVLSIRIDSEWLGFASPPRKSSTLELVRSNDSFLIVDEIPQKVEGHLVEALVSALHDDPIDSPNAANMGFTPEWLKCNVDWLMEELFKSYSPEGQNRFRPKLSNFDYFSSQVAGSFQCYWTDDYPNVCLTIFTKSGGTIRVNSSSQQPFMIPWTIENSEFSICTHNARLGRAIASLLPPGFVNRERLGGEGVLVRAFFMFNSFVEEELLDCPSFKVDGHAKGIERLMFSRDAKHVISTSYDSEMKCWDTTTWIQRHRIDTRRQGANLSFAFSPDQRLLAFNDARVLKLMDIETAEVRQALEGHNWIVRNLTISADGLLLASADGDEIILWDIPRGSEIARIKNEKLVGFSFDSSMLLTATPDRLFAYDIPSFNRMLVAAECDQICLASDGTGLVWTNKKSGIHVWDLRVQREVALIKQYEVSHLTLSTGCSFLCCTVDDGATVLVVNLQLPPHQFTIKSDPVLTSLLIADDASCLVMRYQDSFVIWDVNSRSVVGTYRTRDFRCIALSPDSKTVLTGHRDGSIRVWSIDLV